MEGDRRLLCVLSPWCGVVSGYCEIVSRALERSIAAQCMEVSYRCDSPFVSQWNISNPAPPKLKSNENIFL